MITIPGSSKKFNQPNTSDLFGSIYYTKNINFDEPGYAKISNRSVRIKSDASDATFGIPTSFGRTIAGQFFLPTSGNNFVSTINNTSLSVVTDPNTGAPTTLGFTTSGEWWNNRWHVTSPSSLYSRDTTTDPWVNVTGPAGASDQGTWDASTNTPTLQSGIGTSGFYYTVSVAGNTTLDGISVWNVGDIAYFNGNAWQKIYLTSIFTSGNIHVLEVFRNRNTLCVSDGNKVLQFDTNYVHQAETDLILPQDYEVTGISYSGNRVGIITRLSSEVAGKNIDAFFFVWDGASADANSGYPIGSDSAIAVFAYKSSWVVLNRKGQLLYFNGGGFDVLATFPFYFKDQIWGDFQNRLAYGDSIQVDGDRIFINIASNLNTFGIPIQNYSPTFQTGIWCYDKDIGLYHRFSPSISQGEIAHVQSSGVNITNNQITITTGGTVPVTGSPVRYIEKSGATIGGLSIYSTYYIINVSSSVFKLATTRQNALDGVSIDITSIGGLDHYFFIIHLVDYGTSRSSRIGAIGIQGVTSQAYQTLIYGGYFPGTDGTLEEASLCIDVPYFPSRGYMVTAKVSSDQIEDMYQKVITKYSGLGEGDSMILKYQTNEAEGMPISTQGQSCTWIDEHTFTTTQDISAVKSFLDAASMFEVECEIISGSGGGQSAKVTDISFVAGIYTVTLGEDMEGITAGDLCDTCFDSWTEFDRITSSNPDGYKESLISNPSKEVLVKTELRGAPHKMRFEGQQIINSTSRLAE